VYNISSRELLYIRSYTVEINGHGHLYTWAHEVCLGLAIIVQILLCTLHLVICIHCIHIHIYGVCIYVYMYYMVLANPGAPTLSTLANPGAQPWAHEVRQGLARTVQILLCTLYLVICIYIYLYMFIWFWPTLGVLHLCFHTCHGLWKTYTSFSQVYQLQFLRSKGHNKHGRNPTVPVCLYRAGISEPAFFRYSSQVSTNTGTHVPVWLYRARGSEPILFEYIVHVRALHRGRSSEPTHFRYSSQVSAQGPMCLCDYTGHAVLSLTLWI
jgi:hypothetical protein